MKYKSQMDCNECLGPGEEAGYVSNCCGEPFHEPGWPDIDICTGCGEHSDAWECPKCDGKGYIEFSFPIPKVIQEQIDEKNNTS